MIYIIWPCDINKRPSSIPKWSQQIPQGSKIPFIPIQYFGLNPVWVPKNPPKSEQFRRGPKPNPHDFEYWRDPC